MKNLFTALLILFSSLTFAQDSTKVQEASIKALASHGYLTLFVGKEIQTTGLVEYLQRDFDCRPTGKDNLAVLKNGDQVLNTSFVRSIPGERKETPIHFAYTLTSKGGTFGKGGVIKKVIITGDRIDLAELFLFYWPTKVTAEDIKHNRAATERLLSDKIIFKYSAPDQATITITHL